MAMLDLTTTSSAVALEHFLWDSKHADGSRHGVCEISDLGNYFKFSRLYDDACDEGMAVIGHRETIHFFVNEITRNADNDICTWELKSLNKFGREDGRFNLTIFND